MQSRPLTCRACLLFDVWTKPTTCAMLAKRSEVLPLSGFSNCYWCCGYRSPVLAGHSSCMFAAQPADCMIPTRKHFCNTSNKELCKMKKFSEVGSYRSCTFEFLCSNLAAPMRIRQFCTKLRSGQAENIPVLVSKHLLAKWPQASPVAMREGSHISNSSIYFGSIISLCSMHG